MIMKTEEHEKRGIFHKIGRRFLRLMEWIGNARKDEILCKG
jgi:hypothetical protein